MTEPERILKPTGSLTMKEVPAWHSKTLHPAPLPTQVDLSAVERTDSSALAWLLELQSRAKREQLQLAFINPPKALITLASLSSVEKLLGWEHADEHTSTNRLNEPNS